MRYVVDIEAFHGPLDLLLYLIEKDELDIYDIPVSAITDQYLEYLESTGDFDLERLGDFLIMASYLLNLKSRMLLPHFPVIEEEETDNNIDPREELVQRLLDYKKYKEAAEHLKSRQNGQCKRIFYRDYDNSCEPEEQISGNVKALFHAYLSLVRDRTKTDSKYRLPQGDINIGDKMEEIMERVQERPRGLVFQDLFAGVLNVREALALFLALLELIRLRRVKAIQEKFFADIIIVLRVGD